MTDEREALDHIIRVSRGIQPILAAADAYGDARELKGHVAACETLGGKLTRTDIGWDSQHCGEEWDGETWHCDRAPRRTA